MGATTGLIVSADVLVQITGAILLTLPDKSAKANTIVGSATYDTLLHRGYFDDELWPRIGSPFSTHWSAE